MMTINKYLTKVNYNKMNDTSRIKYIVIHYVGALSDAKSNCAYFYNVNRNASSHYFVGYKGDIWQCVEDGDVAWHCGVKGEVTDKNCNNQNSISIEMCVRKKNTKTMYATDKDWYFEDATVNSTIALTKELMKKYHVPVENVIRHYDVTGKICPNPYVYNTGKHTWDEFKKAISQVDEATQPNDTITQTWYRVRESWNKPETQKGAFHSLQNAKECADANAGFSVYDENGNTLYTSFKPYLIQVSVSDLNIRAGAGTNYKKIRFIPKGVYTIIAEANGKGATKWGQLKSKEGWIALDYVSKV